MRRRAQDAITIMALLLATAFLLAEEPGVTATGEGLAADVAPVLTPRVRWSQSLSAVGDHECLPVTLGPGGKRMYTVSDGALIVLEPESGKVLTTMAGAFRGGPVHHGTMLLVTGDDWLKAVDLASDDPAELWIAKTVGPIQSVSKYSEVLGRSRATVVGGRAIFGGPGKCGNPANASFTDTRLYAVDVRSGARAWILDFGNRMVDGRMLAADADLGLCFVALTGERIERTVAIQNGPEAGQPRFMAFGDANGVLIAVDVHTGQEKWRRPIGSHMSASGPVLADGVIYCAGDSEAIALRAADGTALWHAPRSNLARPEKRVIPPPPVVVTRELFVAAMGDTVDAFRRTDGQLRWSVKRNHNVGVMTMAAARHIIYTAASHSGIVQAIDSITGAVPWEHSLPVDQATACVSLLPMNGRLVVGSRSPSPRIYCLENALSPDAGETRP